MKPDGWQQRKLRDFANRSKSINVDGVKLPPLSITKGQGVILQSEKYKKQIATDLRKYVVARRNQFAFDPMSLYYGAIGQVTQEAGLVSPDYVVFDVDSSVNKRFMNYIFRWPEQVSVYEAVAETGNQFGKRRRVYWSVFEELEFTLPPVEEQRKIATILSSVDDAIEGTQAVIDQLHVVKKAMMAELLTRGLPGRHTRFKQTEIGQVPEGWEVVRLGRLAELQPGFPFKSSDFSTDGDRLLRGSNVGVGVLDWSPAKTVYFPLERRNEVREYVLEAGDIIVAMDRPFINEGFKIARVPEGDPPALLLQRVGRFRRYTADREYVWSLLHSQFVQGHLRVQQKGTDLPHISKSEVESCLVPRPELDEQVRIGIILGGLDSRLLSEREYLLELSHVKSALMFVLLSGDVRVTSDENSR